LNLPASPLSGIYQLNEKNAVGYSWRIKSYTNFDGISKELTLLDFTDFTEPSLMGKSFNQGKLSFQQMQLSEHTFNYARTVVDDKKKVIKAGIGVKVLNGITAQHLYTEGGEVTFNPNGQLSFDNMEFNYGKSNDTNQLNTSNLGIGLDIGVVYEHRPEHKYQYYEMDNVDKNPSKHLNKYQYKIGASITNIGGIKFEKDPATYDFYNPNNVTIDYNALYNAGINKTYLQTDVLPLLQKSADNKDKFRMSLPTALNLQVDYKIIDNVYVNYSGSLPIWFRGDKSKVHDLMTNTFSGRYEIDKFSAGLPITIQRNGQINAGLYARVILQKFIIFMGANNINNLLGQRRAYNGNVYAGIIIGKLYKKPSDLDNDKISDPIDLCPTDSGSWKMKGCPDADGDKTPNYKDFCPYSAGPKKYNGCPDTDGDGIFDYEDNCPTQKGLRVNNGCPDRDKDGIIDTVDRCPDVPGVYENNGCPLEPLVCCLDSDGDGISDAIDSCAYEPGPAENNGCPTSAIKPIKDKTKYEKIDRVKQDEKYDITKAEIETKTVKEVLTDMTTIDFINIYFDVDKNNVQDQYKQKLKGFVDKIGQNANTLILVMAHTDSDGSVEYNMGLSARRSQSTKEYLVNILYVNEKRIVIKNYGEEKPATENETVENKSKNRRVVVRLMNLH
jgi:outer membrane protein OmpA-like peptidoglycan-associated protein